MDHYLRNAWYMAGWGGELGEAGLTRQLLGKPMYFFSKSDGGIAALHDRCPHRFAPLSCGTRDGDAVTCGYHGLTFSADGTCIRNPFADRTPVGAQVASFAALEQDGILWFWAGDQADADAALIPRFPFIPDSPGSKTLCGYTLMQANYEYGTDNLMDLSHIEFVHKGSFAGQGVIFSGDHKVTSEGDTLHSDWWMSGIAPPSVAQGVFPPDAQVDHWLEMRWNAPASMRLLVGVCPHGTPREDGFEVPQAHILTPANEHETHYFWSTTRANDLDVPEVDAALTALFRQAFDEEDKPIIEAAYANVRGKDFWAEQPLSLGIDQGGTRARRMLQSMIAKEGTST